MKKIITLLIISALIVPVFTQNNQEKKDSTTKMQCFEDAKLGIFIHYGIYAVKGVSESWSFHNNQISEKDYFDQLNGFTAKKIDAGEWAKLFKESGAKYAVLTAKHHDGVALCNTKQNNLSVAKKSPAKRDLITPYAQALRQEGLKVGIYFSHLDWSHPDYATVFNHKDAVRPTSYNFYDYPKTGVEDTVRWNRFVAFRNAQLKEFQNLVNPDLWWFDGDWTRTALQWKMKELRDEMLSWNPKTILNSRMEDGTFTQPQIDRLKGLGRWTNKHAEAIYGTTSGLPFGHFYGPTTLSKDRKTIYCFVLDTPKDDIVLKGVRNKIKQVRLVGTTENLSFKRNGGAIENN